MHLATYRPHYLSLWGHPVRVSREKLIGGASSQTSCEDWPIKAWAMQEWKKKKRINFFEKPSAFAGQRNGEAQLRIRPPEDSRKSLISDSPSALVAKPSIDGWDFKVICRKQKKNNNISKSEEEQRTGLIKSGGGGNLFEGEGIAWASFIFSQLSRLQTSRLYYCSFQSWKKNEQLLVQYFYIPGEKLRSSHVDDWCVQSS